MASHLEFKDTKDLKFSHTPQGVMAKYKNNLYILGLTSISHQNINFSDEEFLGLGESVLKFECAVRNLPVHKIDKLSPVSSEVMKNDYSSFSKYVSNNTFEKYIRKGIWQLGTIEQYRSIEDHKKRDEFEGFSFLNFNINNHVVSQVCSTGFNYLIFCGTKSGNSLDHKKQFGEKELIFPNVRSFAEGVKKSIGAKRYFVQEVEYNSLKLYIRKGVINNPSIDINNILTPEYFEILKKYFVYPNLFVKPEFFSPETEVRLVFEMEKDYKKPLRFENKLLLDYIRF